MRRTLPLRHRSQQNGLPPIGTLDAYRQDPAGGYDRPARRRLRSELGGTVAPGRQNLVKALSGEDLKLLEQLGAGLAIVDPAGPGRVLE